MGINKRTRSPGLTTEERANKGRMATSATVNNAAVMELYQANLTGPGVGFMDVYESLVDRVEAVQGGNLAHIEAMLFSQATALQTLFASLARKAAVQDQLLQYQTHLGLALKAQAASRATLEALVELKRPRQAATFINQANVASGPQQNNTVFSAAPAPAEEINSTEKQNKGKPRAAAHAEEITTMQNELLEAPHGDRLDTRAQGQAGGCDPGLEALGAVHRAPHR
jgi:hypothetical protein